MAKSIFVIDGAEFSSYQEFALYFSRVVLAGRHAWNGSLDAFNDILRGGFGTPEGGFVLRWKNSSLSRARLTEQVPGGETLFEALVEIVRDHCPGGEQEEDGVELELL